jgi:hypothetical protein
MSNVIYLRPESPKHPNPDVPADGVWLMACGCGELDMYEELPDLYTAWAAWRHASHQNAREHNKCVGMLNWENLKPETREAYWARYEKASSQCAYLDKADNLARQALEVAYAKTTKKA